jgi:glycosyltransferase involved in cell wall biosynthesis
MKIVQISFSDFGLAGGTSIALYRLHQGLKKIGVCSKILCHAKTLASADSARIPYSRVLEKLLHAVISRLGLNDIHAIRTFWLPQHKDYQEADIVNLHSIHSGYFNYLALPYLTRTKPTVWVLHDVWPFTGHCAASYDCDRWKTGCGKCPHPDTWPAVRRDGTVWEWKLKKWAYERSHLSIIVPSRWMEGFVRQGLLSHFPVYFIPHGVDLETYQPWPVGEVRKKLGIPQEKKVILISSVHLTQKRKGGDLLVKTLQLLPASLKKDVVLLTMGRDGEAISKAAQMNSVHLGYIENEKQKAMAYAASDIFLFPTRWDNCPLGVLESMACGTPIITTNIGGVPELVREGLNGMVIPPESPEALAGAVIKVLEDDPLRLYMREQRRRIAVEEYSLDLQIARYVDLYKNILDESRESK